MRVRIPTYTSFRGGKGGGGVGEGGSRRGKREDESTKYRLSGMYRLSSDITSVYVLSAATAVLIVYLSTVHVYYPANPGLVGTYLEDGIIIGTSCYRLNPEARLCSPDSIAGATRACRSQVRTYMGRCVCAVLDMTKGPAQLQARRHSPPNPRRLSRVWKYERRNLIPSPSVHAIELRHPGIVCAQGLKTKEF